MAQDLHINPATYDRAVQEAKTAHVRGNPTHARVLAMTAGIDAGVMGLTLDDGPFNKPGLVDLHTEWIWGRKVAVSSNDNKEQRRLL